MICHGEPTIYKFPVDAFYRGGEHTFHRFLNKETWIGLSRQNLCFNRILIAQSRGVGKPYSCTCLLLTFTYEFFPGSISRDLENWKVSLSRKVEFANYFKNIGRAEILEIIVMMFFSNGLNSASRLGTDTIKGKSRAPFLSTLVVVVKIH